MSVAAGDLQWSVWRPKNELLMYSVHLEQDSITNKTTEGVPFIHFDHADEHPAGSDRYRAIADARSVVLRSNTNDMRTHINLRFKIIEMAPADPLVRTAVEGVADLSAGLSSLSVSLPYLSVLTPAVSLAGNVGRTALDSLSIPHRGQEIDMRFRLLPRDPATWPGLRTGDYLRFGWYFLLAEPVDAKLYASTSTAKNVRLLTYSPTTGKYFPLLHVTYIVVNVSPPSEDLRGGGQRLTEEHLKGIRTLCENASTYGADELQQKIVDLMQKYNSDVDMVQVVNPARRRSRPSREELEGQTL
jgi:hypothetical protein